MSLTLIAKVLRAMNSIIMPVVEKIYAPSLRNVLFLKACGFVEYHQAQILDVTEDFVKVRLGGTWLQRLLGRKNSHHPVEVTLNIRPEIDDTISEEERIRLPKMDCSQIDVRIAPSSRLWKDEDFYRFSRRLMWSLRDHFMSP